MNYQKHYDTLINRAKNRLLEGYSERHHIVPRCMGGTDEQDNLVTLTAEEHYVAHQLLVKMYPGNGKLVHAAQMMTVSSSGQIRNNKLYGWLRLKTSASIKEFYKNNPEKHSMNNPEARAKLSASLKEYYRNNPEKNPMNNSESRAKMSASLKEYYRNNPEKHPMKNPESRATISASLKEHYRKKKLANG